MHGRESGGALLLRVRLRLGNLVGRGGPLVKDKVRGGLTHDSALTRQCNALLVPHEESGRVVMRLA